MARGGELLNQLAILCSSYNSLENKSEEEYLTMKRMCNRAEHNWSVTLNNIDTFGSQLTQVVDTWVKYRNK